MPSIFLSYCSKDKRIAKKIANDLNKNNISVWFDEWDIKIGDFITEKIQEGLENVDFIVVLLSKASVQSNWVEKEWQSTFRKEMEERKIKVLPLKIEDCKIPYLLKDKKYADLNKNYRVGLEKLLNVINNNTLRKTNNRFNLKKIINKPISILIILIIAIFSIIFGFFITHYIMKIKPTIDYNNYLANYSIRVKNNTKHELVLFKNIVELDYIIGGVPKFSSIHGLPRSVELFNESCNFIVKIIKAKDFYKYINNLQNAPILTSLFIRYNYYKANMIPYEINNRMGGNGCIIINNSTPLNVELRLNGIDGDSIGYAPKKMGRTILYLKNNISYTIFPVFREYSEILDEIITVYPKWSRGILAGHPKFEAFNLIDEIILNFTMDYLGDIELNMGYAIVVIDNQSTYSIEMCMGNEQIYTTSGSKILDSGDTCSIDIKMIKYPDKTYGTERKISTLAIGPTSSTTKNLVDMYIYKAGNKYLILVRGSSGNFSIDQPHHVGVINFMNLF